MACHYIKNVCFFNPRSAAHIQGKEKILTLNQLKNSVIDLGFETALDKEEMLLPALSRALYTIYLDRPRLKVARLSFPTSYGRIIAPIIPHKGGEVISYTLEGEAYSFRISGKGRYTISYGAICEEVDFDADMAEIKGRATPPIKITFSGEYAYTVYSLASFASVSSPDKQDIPIYGDIKTSLLRWHYPHQLLGSKLRSASSQPAVGKLPSFVMPPL